MEQELAAIALTCALVFQPAAAQQATWSGIPPGVHAVGYQLRYMTDPTRTLLPDSLHNRPTNRVIPVRIWYPARNAERAELLTFARILDVRSGSASIPAVAETLAERTRGLHRYAARKYASAGSTTIVPSDTSGLVAAALRVVTLARLNALPEPGKHSLIVFAGGTAHSTDENVALWEYLASQGWVVAALPTVAIDAHAEEAYLPDDALGLETLTRDMETVLAVLGAESWVDGEKVGAVGFSFGGAAAVVTAARNSRIRVVVGLDPSFIARRHQPTITGAPLFDAKRIHVPVLEFHRADTTVDLSLVNAMAGEPRVSFEFSGLDHVDFNSYMLLYGPFLHARRAVAARDSAIAAKAAIYRAEVVATNEFLKRAFRDSTVDSLPDVLRGVGTVWSNVPAAGRVVRIWPK